MGLSLTTVTGPMEFDLTLTRRGLGGSLPKNNNFTPHQVVVQQCIAIVCTSVSLAIGSIAFYWFVRMRRMFRHRLIMLLIISDMFKALWYWISSVKGLAAGPHETHSWFCQASGFFIAFATEASDFAILMIAIHATLYVFQINATRGEAGLYAYRYYAYACWIAYPTLMATLAFVNPSSAYIFGGTFCALPVRPFWYRLALSWIPRYIIISMVITIYLAVYLYVRHKFKDINQDAKGGTTYPTLNDNSADLRPNDINGTKIPTKERSSDAHHNSRTLPRWLSPTPPESVAKSGEDSINESGPSPSHQTQATWENYSFGGSCPISNIPPQDCIDSLQQTANTTPPVDHHSSTASTAFERRGSRPSLATINSRTSYDFSQAIRDSRVTSYAPTFTNSSTSATTNHALFPAKPSQTTAANFVGVLSPVQLSNIEEDEPNATRTLSQSHKSIKRKLRLLFIYPLFYMLMWIVPFASHCLQYSDYYSMNPPYLLSTFSIVFLGLQGAVDSLLFSQREKPWRHASNHSFCRITRSKSKQRRDRSNRKTGKESVSMPMASVETNTVTTPKGSMLGTSKNRPALRKSLVRKSVGRDKDWWDVEGRMRSDSVMLATDHNCADHDRIVRLHSGDQEDTIEEEHTGEARHEDNIDSTGAKSA